jgi:hypothetical protein
MGVGRFVNGFAIDVVGDVTFDEDNDGGGQEEGGINPGILVG